MSNLTLTDAKIEGVENVAAFWELIRFTATPKPFREIQEQGELALKVGVHETTLSRYKRHPQFWNLVKEEFKEWAKDRTPNVMASVYKKVLQDGTAAEAKLWLQYIEDWKEKTETENKHLIKQYVVTRGEPRDPAIHSASVPISNSDTSSSV